jgi:hypothetical protein
LNENQLDFIRVYKESVDFFSLQYKALSASSRSEMNVMEKIYNARVLSRIGFVAQEMKDLESDLLQDIDNRAIEINNNNAECLLEAQRNLSNSSESAGKTIKAFAMRASEDIQTLNEIAVYPVLHEIESLRSIFEVEIFNIFAYINSVTNIMQLFILLESEIQAYGVLFEYYVNEIYTEMVIYGILFDDLSQEIFPLLDAGLEQFRTSASIIRSSLTNCN